MDGFNEITPMDFGEVRRAISKEIAELLTFPNLRIILTSRENEFYHLPLSSFEIIRANGINEDDVIRFLQSKCTPGQLESLRTNTTLMQYLRIPLFLLMYANSTHTDTESPQNRGSILFSYFNGRQAFYTEKLNAEEKNTREAYYMVSVLLDFILPDLGYYMKSRNVFQITEEQLFDLTETAVASAKRFVGLNSDAYHHYEQRPSSLKRALALFTDKLEDEDILSLLSDLLCVILSDANRNLSFAHQYIRDYFSALYCVREFYYMNLIARHQPALLSEIDHSWGDSLWDDEQISLVQEILSIPSDFQCNDLIAQTMGLFRSNNYYPLPNMNYALSNLISVLALANDGDLFNYDFSYLDLRNCTLANYNFHHFDGSSNSSFRGANIGLDTFSTNAHEGNVLKWALSDDGQFIISISPSLELKVWNISTQKCIITRECPGLDNVVSIGTLELREQGSLALITYKDESGHAFAAATYSLLSNLYTLYLLPDTHIRNITYLGYDADSNTLISILDTGKVYCYEMHEEEPISQFHLKVMHPAGIGFFHLLSKEKLLYRSNRTAYIYDLSSGCSTALVFPEDRLLAHIAVSRDNKLIALEAHGLFYIYHVETPDQYFPFPVGLSTDEFNDIAFCHENPNIITAFGSGPIYHLDCTTGNIIYRTYLSPSQRFVQYAISQQYFITQDEAAGTTTIRVTNIYTNASTVFFLSNQKPLMDTYVDCIPDVFQALYANGTLLTFNADTLKMTNCFNYAPGRFISASTQSDQDALLCFASVPNSFYPQGKQTQLTVVDLITGRYTKSQAVFEQLFELRFIDRNTIIGLSETEILLVDLETFQIKSRCEHRGNILDSPTHIFIEGKRIHITSEYAQIIAHAEYSATVDTYEIDQDNVISKCSVFHIPCPWQIIPHCPLMYSILDTSGLAMIKAIKPSEETYMAYRKYEYTTPDESHFRMSFGSDNTYELLDHWTLASLGNSHAPFGLKTVEDGNVQVDEKFFDSKGDNLICVGDSYYEHRVASHECIPLDSKLFTNVDRLNYSRKKRSIYYNDRHSSSIHRYDIDSHRTEETSNYLHPHILVYGCDFSRCDGYFDRLPWYMIKRY